MTTVTIIGPAPSSYARTARWACAEKGVEHELVAPGDDYPTVHPWGKVPSMRHGDVTLFETSAICRYIDEAFEGPALMPADPAQRAIAEQWISALNDYGYKSLVRGYALEHFVLPRLRGREPNLDGIDDSVARLNADLLRFETGFAGPWFVGDTLSIADLFLGPMLATAAAFPQGNEAIARCSKLASFLAAISDRGAYQSIQPR